MLNEGTITLTLPIHEHLQLHASQYKHKTQHLSHTLHKHTTYYNTPRLKKHYLLQRLLHNKHFHTSIVSRHLATRGNTKILRTPPPHISSSEEILPRLTRRTLAQLKSYLHKVDGQITSITTMPPSVTLTHSTHIISSTAPTYAPHCHPWIWGKTQSE